MRIFNEFPPNAGKPFTAVDDQVIRAMHELGKSVEQIAAQLQRTVPGTQARITRLGLVAPDTTMRKRAAFLRLVVDNTRRPS